MYICIRTCGPPCQKKRPCHGVIEVHSEIFNIYCGIRCSCTNLTKEYRRMLKTNQFCREIEEVQLKLSLTQYIAVLNVANP